jgi:hypothetical protein
MARKCYSSVYRWYGLLQAGKQAMSFGVALRNSVAIGLGGIIALFSGRAHDQAQNDLLTESNDNLVQEDGGLILLE